MFAVRNRPLECVDERLRAAFAGTESRTHPVIRVGLLGCGNISHLLAAHAEGFVITALYDQDPDRARELRSRPGGTAYDSFEAFVGADVDLVVEAASIRAVRAHSEAVLGAGKDFVVMSVGALADPVFLARLREAAVAAGRRVYIPAEP